MTEPIPIKYKNDIYLDTRGILHNKKKLSDVLYPINYIIVTSTNINPSSTYGGTWELVYKGFKELFTTDSSGTYFTRNTTNCSEGTLSIKRTSDNLFFKFRFVNSVAISDGSTEIFTLNLSNLGINGIGHNFQNMVGGSDGGNAVFTFDINTGGTMNITDVVGKSTNTLPVNSISHIDVSIPISTTEKLDSECDKFYWKRTF